MAEHVFGIEPREVRTVARAMGGEARTLTSAASDIHGGVPPAASLPGGCATAAATAGAGRVGDAVTGEAAVVEVVGRDLHSFVDAVTDAEAGSSLAFAGTKTR
ncbi:MAG TPA: hypothetical protein H9870_13110 [Candidatus Corynebacterium avicola]|uniref:Uncharacterized protein n=1 Tax=Candidatus Corynebacterium avicola TaxID=2838527 RepID=A0A9D1RS61_9CORY|nr:hypothetical protein [Candidatus Corynebacterium avicola]